MVRHVRPNPARAAHGGRRPWAWRHTFRSSRGRDRGAVEDGKATSLLLSVVAVLAVCAMLIPAVVVVSAAEDCSTLGLPASELAVEEIPADYLVLSQRAAAEAGIPWAVLAAIGWVESRHGTLDAPGVRDGMNEAGAAGPMQFGIGGRAGNTWGGEPIRAVPPQLAYGVDGNGDGVCGAASTRSWAK